MKKALIITLSLLHISVCFAQPGKGFVERKTFTAPSLQNNKGGEEAERQVSVYLPPGYNKTKQRYPVIYFLHGYLGNDKVMMEEWGQFMPLMDSAISAGLISPMILVTPNSNTRLGGSFYNNSALTGNWADYIGKDVVSFIDRNYRTIANRNNRGLCGHSMGGNGALKVGMIFADTFGAVYAMSPAVLNWHADFNVNSKAFKKIGEAKDIAAIMKGINESMDGFFAAALSAIARSYASSAADNILQAGLPVQYTGDSMVLNTTVINQWEAQFPCNMIDQYLPQLKSLTALKMDWGRNEDFPHIPFTSLQFSKKLEAYGITHFAEEYIGDHGNMLGGFNGRIFTEMLPFFQKYLR